MHGPRKATPGPMGAVGRRCGGGPLFGTRDGAGDGAMAAVSFASAVRPGVREDGVA